MATDPASDTTAGSSHAIFRPVQAGNWQPCFHCLETIDFVPGGHRMQVTCKTYRSGRWLQVEHYHPGCYEACDHPTHMDVRAA